MIKKITDRLQKLPISFGNYKVIKKNGVYSLFKDNYLIMDSSNGEIKKRKCLSGISYGNVVVGGLGLGYTILLLRKNPRVENIICVEIDRVLLKTVAPIYPEASFVYGDIFRYIKKQSNFDTLILTM
jgi:hypothetical protein